MLHHCFIVQANISYPFHDFGRPLAVLEDSLFQLDLDPYFSILEEALSGKSAGTSLHCSSGSGAIFFIHINKFLLRNFQYVLKQLSAVFRLSFLLQLHHLNWEIHNCRNTSWYYQIAPYSRPDKDSQLHPVL